MRVACAVVIRNGRALVQRRKRREGFSTEFPMGRVEEGEDFGQAALRELFEETGLEGKLLPLSPEIITRDGVSVAFVAIGIASGAAPEGRGSREQVFYWMTQNEIPVAAFLPADRDFINDKLGSWLSA